MFLKFIKNFGLKKTIKKLLAKYQPGPMPDAVNTVGVVIDERYFNDRNAIVKELVKHGIAEKNIELLSYRERLNAKETVDCCYYTYKDIDADGNFKKDDVAAFINKPFDMLVSYYDTDSFPLMLATLKSNAKFKAGFSSTDSRLHHFMVNTTAEKHKEFLAELFKYLKILNKI